MTTFQLIAIPSCLGFAIVALSRRSVLSRSQSFFWAFLWLTAAGVIALPQISNRIAHLVGIGRGADLVLYVMCFASILLSRYFYQKQRKLENALTQLARQDAIRHAIGGVRSNGGAQTANLPSSRAPVEDRERI
jgi:small membrane protein